MGQKEFGVYGQKGVTQMSGIQKRTVYYVIWNKMIRFFDWAHCITSVGVMAEPFMANQRTQSGCAPDDFNFEDDCTRIDEMVNLDQGSFNQKISCDESMPTVGGLMMPRVGP
jgi:hypothetical protein